VNYLIDTSALVRVLRRQVDTHWDDVVDRGLIAVCEPVLVEALSIADAKQYEQVERDIRDLYPMVAMPDDVWDIVRAVRRDLAAHSQHRGLSVADHLVVATAIRLKLVVLHQDADFETVSRFVPQLRQERLGP
jgi:predicted nucleic acid-binding protein